MSSLFKYGRIGWKTSVENPSMTWYNWNQQPLLLESYNSYRILRKNILSMLWIPFTSESKDSGVNHTIDTCFIESYDSSNLSRWK